jgi:hypothetical protein
LSATLAIASGGTGQTTAISAFNALAPSQSGNSGKYLTTDGTNSSWGTVSGGGGAVADGCIYLNNLTISSNYTIAATQGAISVGPITLAGGATVTVSSGSRYVVL